MNEFKNISQLIDVINKKGKFELIGGAGSGKTTTLLNLISKIPNKKLLVISFTNVAKDEINERFQNNNEDQQMDVSTIHSFARKFMKNNYELVNNFMEQNWPKYISDKTRDKLEQAGTKYRGFDFFGTANFDNQEETGKIYVVNRYLVKLFADAVLNNKNLAAILDNLYDVILIDEFQDTEEQLINLLTSNNVNKTSIGFFGDPKQRIYADTLTINYKKNIESFYKKDNYRSSTKIVEFINNYRDDIKQIAKNDEIKNFNSKIKVINNASNTTKFVKDVEKQEKVVFDVVLHLTNIQRLLNIEPDAFDDKTIFNTKPGGINKSNFIMGKGFTMFIFKLLQFIDKDDKIHERFWIKEEDLDTGEKFLVSENDKIIINEKLSKILDDIYNMNSVVKALEILNKIRNDKILMEKISFFVNENVIANFESPNVLKVKWKTIENAYDLWADKSSNKTMHSIKGQEFDNVAIFLEDAKWWKYNFNKYFNGISDNGNGSNEQTENLLYVSISRSKKNLFLFIPSNQQIELKDVYKIV